MIDVEVQMLGVLILPQIRQDARRTMLTRHVGRDGAHDLDQLLQEARIGVSEVDQRRDVLLGNDHDVNRPEGLRVVIGQHAICLVHHADRGAPT